VFAMEANVAANARFGRPTPAGPKIWRTPYFGPPPSPSDPKSLDPTNTDTPEYVPPVAGEIREPQTFLVEQEPGAIVHPHFHYVNQFQVVVDGHGTLGKDPVRAVTVHFSGAYTGYGPIAPAPGGGLKYFTLRANADSTGAQYLPVSRRKMKAMPRRHMLVDPIDEIDVSELKKLSGETVETRLSGPDGLSVQVAKLGPSATWSVPNPFAVDRSVLVLSGSVLRDGTEYGRWSAFFASGRETMSGLKAGTNGAQALILDYPKAEV
jgi:hypothetical protein